MRTVGIREIKSKLSEYLRQVREGERILVTDRGRVVAELREPGPVIEGAGVPPRLWELATQGLVRLGSGQDPSLYPELPRLTPDGTAAQLLTEDRGEQ